MKIPNFSSVTSVILVLVLVSCRNGDSTDIGNEMAFAWYTNRDYTNIYNGGDPTEGGVPVIPGGCDSAKWNNQYVLTKGHYWRYAVRKQAFGIGQVHSDSMFYFVIDKKKYQGGQELDPALHGPLTQQQLVEWERIIPGRYHVPE